MIANAGSDERGKLHGGKAGDQTGGEYRVRTWYNRPWDHCLIPKTRELGELIAEISRAAANNNHIGYDQYERRTYGNALEKANWYPERITTYCETDCSNSTVNAIKAAGHRLGIPALANLSQDLYTGNIRKALVNTGYFLDYTDSKYLKSDAYLLPGYVLLYENHHVAVNLSKGACATVYPNEKATTTATKSSGKAYPYALPTLPSGGYIRKGDKGENVKRLQRFLNWYGNYGLAVDGVFGTKTLTALRKYQKAAGLTVDGQFGPKSLAKAKAVRK